MQRAEKVNVVAELHPSMLVIKSDSLSLIGEKQLNGINAANNHNVMA